MQRQHRRRSRPHLARLSTSLIVLALLCAAAQPLTSQAQEGAGAEFLEEFQLNPFRYLGSWYELARTPNAFEDNAVRVDGERYGPCFDPTATYTLTGLFRIGVFNSCTRESLATPGRTYQEDIDGDALVTPGSGVRKLKVAFGPPIVQLIIRLFTEGGADYWIFGVGPIDSDGLYSWALVSGEARDNIFVLSRTPELDAATLDDILDLAEIEGLPVEKLIFTRR